MQEYAGFNINQTNIAKGVAVLLLLWHHLFYNNSDNYNGFKSLLLYNGVPIECFLADFCKVCVAIFLILSGYGLYKSYSQFETKVSNNWGGTVSIKNSSKYIYNHLIKLLSDYWFIYVLFVPLGLLFDRSFIEIYDKNPINFFADFFGISYLAHNNLDYTMNATWWYMSVCIVYYLAFPVLYKCMSKCPEAFLLFSFLLIIIPIDYAQLTTWLFPFVLGMYFAKYDLFERLSKLFNDSPFNCASFLIFSVLICGCLRYYTFHHSVQFDGIFGLSIIMFSYFVLSKIRIINKIFEELGKYSGLIFMFHTFIYSYYFKTFIYGFKYSILIYIIFVIICYVIARLLKTVQCLISYDSLIKKMMVVKNEKVSYNRC